MKLIDHLKASGETVEDFAARIGEALSTIRKIAYGQRQPSLPLAVKIERATSAAVSGADMLLERFAASDDMPPNRDADPADAPGKISEISTPQEQVA